MANSYLTIYAEDLLRTLKKSDGSDAIPPAMLTAISANKVFALRLNKWAEDYKKRVEDAIKDNTEAPETPLQFDVGNHFDSKKVDRSVVGRAELQVRCL